MSRIAIDTSKSVFTLHGVDAAGSVLLRRNLRRRERLRFFEKLGPVEVALEACGGSHHWARLLPPQYVKPFVKRGKNDRNAAQTGRTHDRNRTASEIFASPPCVKGAVHTHPTSDRKHRHKAIDSGLALLRD